MDSEKISQIADIMRSHGLTRVRVEESDGSAVELECGAAAPVAAPAPAPAAPVAA
ncbi:acetyl-CoA carboxylase biotin carboxyl carrier protein subunit, partial [Olsenella sp. An188]